MGGGRNRDGGKFPRFSLNGDQNKVLHGKINEPTLKMGGANKVTDLIKDLSDIFISLHDVRAILGKNLIS